jgi:hypothetical protein
MQPSRPRTPPCHCSDDGRKVSKSIEAIKSNPEHVSYLILEFTCIAKGRARVGGHIDFQDRGRITSGTVNVPIQPDAPPQPLVVLARIRIVRGALDDQFGTNRDRTGIGVKDQHRIGVTGMGVDLAIHLHATVPVVLGGAVVGSDQRGCIH